jgi:alpha-beta hydrolase superfamily lysophospholipase
MKRLGWLLCGLFWAGTAGAQDYEREQRWAAEVVPNLVAGDAVQLKLPSGREFLGIYSENRKARTAILLVHGLGVHPDHGVIGILRGLLADAGYTTLSIQMPVAAAGAGAEDYPALFPDAAARIQAAADWLAAKGHARPVLLSHSMGSLMVDAYLAQAAAQPFAAWISLGMVTPFSSPGVVRLPVLDAFGEQDTPQVFYASVMRRRALSAVPQSAQLVLPNADHHYTGREKELAAAIGAFLGRTQ